MWLAWFFSLQFDFLTLISPGTFVIWKVILSEPLCLNYFGEFRKFCRKGSAILGRTNPPIGFHQKLIVIDLDLWEQLLRCIYFCSMKVGQILDMLDEDRIETTKEDIE